MSVRSICGVIRISEDPERLARFYGEVLGVAFVREDHGGLAPHWGADIGRCHFGIHPPANFGGRAPAPGGTSIAFDVGSLATCAARLERLGASPLAPPHDEGFGLVASWLDPDGHPFELVELRYTFADGGAD